MKKTLFTVIFTALILISVKSTTLAQEVDSNEAGVKIVEQVKRINRKAKSVEISTKEILAALKKLIVKKRNQREDFLNREIK
jgi:hypothetical protein